MAATGFMMKQQQQQQLFVSLLFSANADDFLGLANGVWPVFQRFFHAQRR